MERQVLGMIHRLVYQEDGAFYRKWMHDPRHTLGVMCSGGTIANLTALWVARNHAFPAEGSFRGLHQEGLYRALKYYGYEGAAILVSKRGHYSLRKAADVLGFGRDALVSVETDDDNRILPDALREKCLELQKQKIKVLAICGVAGTTETGNVDPLDAVADIAREFGAHYHVDAAWGGRPCSPAATSTCCGASKRPTRSPSTPTNNCTCPWAPAWWCSRTRRWHPRWNTTPSTSSARAPGIWAPLPWKGLDRACPC